LGLVDLTDRLPTQSRTVVAVVLLIVIAAILLWQILLGLTSARWDVPLLTFLAFALWIAIYVFLSAHEESA
jgi:heme A synthase